MNINVTATIGAVAVGGTMEVTIFFRILVLLLIIMFMLVVLAAKGDLNNQICVLLEYSF